MQLYYLYSFLELAKFLLMETFHLVRVFGLS
jgi:hypothetical protein